MLSQGLFNKNLKRPFRSLKLEALILQLLQVIENLTDLWIFALDINFEFSRLIENVRFP